MMAYEACQEFEWPLLFHLDDIRCMDVPTLPHLERALKAFPKVNFIGHAAGFWASISGDANAKDFQSYPKRKTVPGGALDRLMETVPEPARRSERAWRSERDRAGYRFRAGISDPASRSAAVRGRITWCRVRKSGN